MAERESRPSQLLLRRPCSLSLLLLEMRSVSACMQAEAQKVRQVLEVSSCAAVAGSLIVQGLFDGLTASCAFTNTSAATYTHHAALSTAWSHRYLA